MYLKGVKKTNFYKFFHKF